MSSGFSNGAREIGLLPALGTASIDYRFSVEVEFREQLFVELDGLDRPKLSGREDFLRHYVTQPRTGNRREFVSDFERESENRGAVTH